MGGFLICFLKIHFHYCVYFRMAFNMFGFSGLASQVGEKLRPSWSEAMLGLISGFATNSVALGGSVSLFKPQFFLL